MSSLNAYMKEYKKQLAKGQIQKAYKGIMSAMMSISAHLSMKYPDYKIGSLYYGYMDMTYFPITSPALESKGLKIAVVFLHEECRFEIWLAAKNRKTQAQYIEKLQLENVSGYRISKVAKGVDSIIEYPVEAALDFDHIDTLSQKIESEIVTFIQDIHKLV